MTRRILAAATLALLGGGLWLLAVTLVRIVDWIVGGSVLGWLFLILGVLIIFIGVLVADVATDGKVSGSDG